MLLKTVYRTCITELGNLKLTKSRLIQADMCVLSLQLPFISQQHCHIITLVKANNRYFEHLFCFQHCWHCVLTVFIAVIDDL